MVSTDNVADFQANKFNWFAEFDSQDQEIKNKMNMMMKKKKEEKYTNRIRIIISKIPEKNKVVKRWFFALADKNIKVQTKNYAELWANW